jgi:hypothetical protein
MTIKFSTLISDTDVNGYKVELLQDNSRDYDWFCVSVSNAIIFETDDYYDARSEFEYRIGESCYADDADNADEFEYATESFDSDLWYGNDLFA